MDQDGQLTFEDDPKAAKMKSAINHLRLGQFNEASNIFNTLFEANPDYPGVMLGIRSAEFWKNREAQFKSLENGLEKGKFLKTEWNKFEKFLDESNDSSDLPIHAVRSYIFTEAIHCFTRAYNDTVSPDSSLVYDIGECYYNVGDFKKAVETFEYAWELKRDSSKVLARLADAYFALSDSPEIRKKAKLLFREAFLYSPGEIELNRIKTPYIMELVDSVTAAGYQEEEIAAWVPIFAAMHHLFNVKRELEEHEVVQLTEQAYELEHKLAETASQTKILLPALLNRYIWLIDHYLLERNDSIKVDMLKRKFEAVDPDIYKSLFQ